MDYTGASSPVSLYPQQEADDPHGLGRVATKCENEKGVECAVDGVKAVEFFGGYCGRGGGWTVEWVINFGHFYGFKCACMHMYIDVCLCVCIYIGGEEGSGRQRLSVVAVGRGLRDTSKGREIARRARGVLVFRCNGSLV